MGIVSVSVDGYNYHLVKIHHERPNARWEDKRPGFAFWMSRRILRTWGHFFPHHEAEWPYGCVILAGVEDRGINSMMLLELALIYFWLLSSAPVLQIYVHAFLFGSDMSSQSRSAGAYPKPVIWALIGIGFMKLLSFSNFRPDLTAFLLQGSYSSVVWRSVFLTEWPKWIRTRLCRNLQSSWHRDPCHWALRLERFDGQSVILQVGDDKDGRVTTSRTPYTRSPCAQRSWPKSSIVRLSPRTSTNWRLLWYRIIQWTTRARRGTVKIG